jgi:hypothetical protein
VALKELDLIHHQQLVVRVVLEFLGHGLTLDAGARLIRRRRCCCLGLFSQRNGHGYGVGLGGGGVGWLGALGAISGAGFMLAPKGCPAKPGPPGPGA